MSSWSRPQPLRMVKLVTMEDAFGAKVVAAKLGVEGIVWELKGGLDGPYPFGPVHVFVTEDDLEEARAVLAASEPLEDDDDQDEGEVVERRSRTDRRAPVLLAALVGILGLAAAELVRMLALG